MKTWADYPETYPSRVKLAFIRSLLAIVADLDLQLHQMDFVTIFPNGDLYEDDYKEVLGRVSGVDRNSEVFNLVKCLY